MTIEEIREAAKVMEAYASGKKIQYLNDDNEWIDTPKPFFDWHSYVYRIKPEPKYRPFKTQEECWEEMHKHPDFGWVIYKGHFLNICDIGTDFLTICPDEHTETWDLSKCMSEMTFTDGTPFGIKEE